MPVVADPEGVSAKYLQEFHSFSGCRVLEIGCGKGYITYELAVRSRFITAIDPDEDVIQIASENIPNRLRNKIEFIPLGIEDFLVPDEVEKYDIALFTWSL